MKLFKIVGIFALAMLLASTSIDVGSPVGSVAISLISGAEAVVGRPLTPVSVAGVARRTARRCAVGVYNC